MRMDQISMQGRGGASCLNMVEHGSSSIEHQLALGCELCEKRVAQCVGVASHSNSKWQVARVNGGEEMSTIESIHGPVEAHNLSCNEG